MEIHKFWAPTTPYSLTDALNQAYVRENGGRDVLGSDIRIHWDAATKSYVAAYVKNRRHIVAKGDLDFVVGKAVVEFLVQGDGTTLYVNIPEVHIQDIAYCQKHVMLRPYTPRAARLHNMKWQSKKGKAWAYALCARAVRMDKDHGIPVQFLLDAKSEEEWKQKMGRWVKQGPQPTA